MQFEFLVPGSRVVSVTAGSPEEARMALASNLRSATKAPDVKWGEFLAQEDGAWVAAEVEDNRTGV